MAIYLNTTAAKRLLDSFKKAIDDNKVATWSYDKDGDFTHTPDQWKHKAWLRPTIEASRLKLAIVKPQNGTISWDVYGVYHGRFIESMIVHCHDLFVDGVATPKPVTGDPVTGDIVS